MEERQRQKKGCIDEKEKERERQSERESISNVCKRKGKEEERIILGWRESIRKN